VKRIPKPLQPCTHDVAQWRTSGAEHLLRCCRCQQTLEREFAVTHRDVRVLLFRGETGGYAPFDPKCWQR